MRDRMRVTIRLGLGIKVFGGVCVYIYIYLVFFFVFFVIIAKLSCLGSDLGQVLLKLTLVTRLELHFEFYF